MDSNAFELLMYLDEGLVKNLSSLVLSGYINIRTSKIIVDRTLSGRTGIDCREHFFSEDRMGEDKRDGFIDCHDSSSDHYEQTNRNDANFENREFIRREEEFQRIYTTFTLHSELQSNLISAKAIKIIDNKTIEEGTVSEGEYVKISGKLTSESINSYIDSMLTVFNCFGCDNLDKMITNKNVGVMNFSAMNNFISHLNDILNRNSTSDMILMCGDTPVILNVNSNFFMNNNSYMYDKVNCYCTVFGKIVNVAPNGECISLLRKTAQQEYYESLLNSCCPYCDELKDKGIVLPSMPRLRCEGTSLVVLPISICM